jgi:hypothetical protein
MQGEKIEEEDKYTYSMHVTTFTRINDLKKGTYKNK